MMYPALGIDIGKHTLAVAAPAGAERQKWPVVTLDYRDPDWYKRLVEMLAPDAVVVAEPTGWHYLSPVITVIQQMTTAHLWIAAHEATAAARASSISSAKTDAMDARALALIAARILAGDVPRNIRPFDGEREAAVLTLRLWVNKHARLTKASTRTQNQIDVFAHSLWPALAIRKTTWGRLVALGITTPREVRAFVERIAPDPAALKAAGLRGQNLHFFSALANDLPDVEVNPIVAETIADLVGELQDGAPRIAEAEAKLEQLVTAPPFEEVTRRWMTVPGWTYPAIAALHIAAHGEVDQIDRDAFNAAIGVNPLASQSGGRDNTRRSRKGYRPAMNAVWTWAMALVNSRVTPDNPIRDFYSRLDQANHKHAFAATRTKLCRVLWGVARSPSGYRYVRSAGSPPADQGQKPQEES